jgi:hypothetical protein
LEAGIGLLISYTDFLDSDFNGEIIFSSESYDELRKFYETSSDFSLAINCVSDPSRDNRSII